MVFMRRAYFFLYVFSFLFNSSIGYGYWYINLKDDYVVNSDRREYYAEIVRASGQNNSRSFTIAPSSSSSTTFKADDLSFKIRKSVIDSSLEQYSDILATVKANANLLVNDSLDLIVDDFSDSRTVGRIDFDNRGYVKVKRLNIADNNHSKNNTRALFNNYSVLDAKELQNSISGTFWNKHGGTAKIAIVNNLNKSNFINDGELTSDYLNNSNSKFTNSDSANIIRLENVGGVVSLTQGI